MKAAIEATVTLPVSGTTGYANNSCLDIILSKVGKITLPGDEWDVSGLETIIQKQLTQVVLNIPSGELTLSQNLEVRFDEDCQSFVISGCGTWDGAAAGFMGGMSGYASFSGVFLSVTQGTYKLTSDRNAFGYNDPWSLDAAKYFERISRHRAGIGYNAAIEDAAEAARIQAIDYRTPEVDYRTPEEWQYLREWDEAIMLWEKLTPEEFVEAVNEQALKVGASTSDESLTESAIAQLRAVQGDFQEELATASHLFAERVRFMLIWNPNQPETDLRWMVKVAIGDDFHSWWATPEQVAILDGWQVERRKARNGTDKNSFDYGDDDAEFDYGDDDAEFDYGDDDAELPQG